MLLDNVQKGKQNIEEKSEFKLWYKEKNINEWNENNFYHIFLHLFKWKTSMIKIGMTHFK